MKQKAMETKLVVRPLVGCLTHTHFWEGPCRAGRREDMTEEAEAKAADEVFKSSVEGLKQVIDEVEFLGLWMFAIMNLSLLRKSFLQK